MSQAVQHGSCQSFAAEDFDPVFEGPIQYSDGLTLRVELTNRRRSRMLIARVAYYAAQTV